MDVLSGILEESRSIWDYTVSPLHKFFHPTILLKLPCRTGRSLDKDGRPRQIPEALLTSCGIAYSPCYSVLGRSYA